MNLQKLFLELYNSPTEDELEKVIKAHPDIFISENWYPLGDNSNNFGIIENQQASPIAALIEKVTNSIDAILMKKCYEAKIDPRSNEAPRNMKDAIKVFFPDATNWDLSKKKKEQAENIQILADGPRGNTSLIIYDDGEGQGPDQFEKTFLSLLKGNKNDIPFVQGKYNMGGTGAIVFCGKKRYQLIASKKYDNTGDFGFTLIRMHPMTEAEAHGLKNTWYEYLKIDNKIPAFPIKELDLGLYNRKFKTGSVIKLYSYDLPEGSRSVISKDLNYSLNEFLFEPALPIYTIDKKERYPDDRNLERELFGLKRRLEQEDNKYVEKLFSEEYRDSLFGRMKVTCYVFKPILEGKNVKESKDSIRREFFKNNMSVVFSMNGQVHGHYTSEFITRSLKFNLLKDYVLIHVDCGNMNYDFRKELFMASRDRLKHGEESRDLRDYLASKLKKSPLSDIYKQRKDSIGLESEDTTDLIKSFAKSLPKDSELMQLLSKTIKLEDTKDKSKKKVENNKTPKVEQEPFKPQRFPSMFKVKDSKEGTIPLIKIPLNGEKNIKFSTDVEDNYFDRSEDPGDLRIGLLRIKYNKATGGDEPGTDKKIEDVINIVKSSPNKGSIKISLTPTKNLKVGDEVEMKVTLDAPGQEFNEIIWVKIAEPEQPVEDAPKNEENFDNLGLPEMIKVKEEEWPQLLAQGIDMGYGNIIYPEGEGDMLTKIYINMDSNVLKQYKAKLKNVSSDQLILADKKYASSVYFHTLLLYLITKKRNYKISLSKDGTEDDIDVAEYIRDIFDSYYSDFLLNFGMEELINSIE